MLKQNNKIHVALAFDENFLTPFYVLITSIFQNNQKNQIVFHTIAAGVSQPEKSRISRFVQEHKGEIIFYEIDQKLVERFVLPEHIHFSAATYYRLFFPELVPPEIQKVLYIDTDIIVIGDLAELYNVDMQELPAAAVPDAKIPARPDLGIYTPGKYFNAGVLLINLALWNKQKISEKAIQYLGEYPERIAWADQDALNAVLINNWLPVGNKFNVTFYDMPEYLPKKKFGEFLKDKVIVHYTTQNKPWMISCTNRLRFLYQYYLKLSPHADKQKYTDLKTSTNLLFRLMRIRLKEFLIDYTQVFKILGKNTSAPKNLNS